MGLDGWADKIGLPWGHIRDIHRDPRQMHTQATTIGIWYMLIWSNQTDWPGVLLVWRFITRSSCGFLLDVTAIGLGCLVRPRLQNGDWGIVLHAMLDYHFVYTCNSQVNKWPSAGDWWNDTGIDVLFPLVCWLIEGFVYQMMIDGIWWYTKPAPLFLPRGHDWRLAIVGVVDTLWWIRGEFVAPVASVRLRGFRHSYEQWQLGTPRTQSWPGQVLLRWMWCQSRMRMAQDHPRSFFYSNGCLPMFFGSSVFNCLAFSHQCIACLL